VGNWVPNPNITLKTPVKGIPLVVFQVILRHSNQRPSTISYPQRLAHQSQISNWLILVWEKLLRKSILYRTRTKSKKQPRIWKSSSFNHMYKQPNSSKKISSNHSSFQSFVSKRLTSSENCSVVVKIPLNSFRRELIFNTVSYRSSKCKLKNKDRPHSLSMNKTSTLRSRLPINN
jgi:hypothetical protein